MRENCDDKPDTGPMNKEMNQTRHLNRETNRQRNQDPMTEMPRGRIGEYVTAPHFLMCMTTVREGPGVKSLDRNEELEAQIDSGIGVVTVLVCEESMAAVSCLRTRVHMAALNRTVGADRVDSWTGRFGDADVRCLVEPRVECS